MNNTPVLQCESHTFLQTHAVRPIKERATAIRQSFEFRKQEDLDAITEFLSSHDVSKVRDFADALRRGPFFIPEGKFVNNTSADAIKLDKNT